MLASPTLLERTSAARSAADCLQPLQLPARRASSSSEPPTAERLAALSRQQLTLPQGPASVRCSVSSAGSHGARSRENSVSGSEAGRATASAEPFAQPPAEWWLASLSRADIVLLLGGYLVLFIRYLVSQQLAGFFTAVADDAGFSATWVGLIFMAYPLGMSLTSLAAPSLVRRIGTRRALTGGLCATVLANLLFGLVPDLCSQPLSTAAEGGSGAACLRYGFWGVYFANGLLGAAAETAILILLSVRFRSAIGTVMAHVNTASTCGCFVGSFLGGMLYDAGPEGDPAMKFRIPFLASTGLVAALLPLRWVVPEERLEETTASAAPLRSVASLSVALGLLAIFLSSCVTGTLDTNLPYRLQAPPFWLSMTELSAVTSLSSAAYLVIMLPVGWAAGKLSSSSRGLKAATGGGFLLLAAAFALLGPIAALRPLNCTASVVGAMVLRAVGSAVSSNFVYPDLVQGIRQEDHQLQASISTLWNAAYAVGWAAGPYAGGAIYAAFDRAPLCTVLQRGQCDEPASGAPPPPCSCEWSPRNGFTGFADVTVAVCAAFAALHLVAAAFDVHDEPPPSRKLLLVEPLRPNSLHDQGEGAAPPPASAPSLEGRAADSPGVS
ncbi:hypothetical protein EMIHUDRAFT_468414 [Emiliania huxleyi CCMP1516]|uniref:Major facilitator superfamily (MFS) profile domain-containing protein n=2 Tax=Emiliania huxleyi TaxID=2903 RepID=A0A0D3K3L3_EMIH1|nr:hypothetical protein EMIHUDRAFT_468414 [Emiliania huxleyi CCMP1516]EOD30348.1 hypothetical protein EMIHUDRAFT_468414 [Emiliania huxleyi CCMP1516]|eukprot:XP_005782777.1 hypothetical protein EMIHUDRAFT_468414 [Emiliania huxleyi CCMP1516]